MSIPTLLIPTTCSDFKIGSHIYIKLNSSIQHDLPINYPINSLDCRNPCIPGTFSHPPTYGQSLHVHPVHISMGPATPNLIPNHFQPPPSNHCHTNWNLKSLKSSTPRLTTTSAASYCILSIGQVWGHWWRNFMEPCFQAQTCFWTCCIFPLCISSQVWPFFKSLTQAHFTSIWSLIWSFHTFSIKPIYFTILLSHSRNHQSSFTAPSPHPSSGYPLQIPILLP